MAKSSIPAKNKFGRENEKGFIQTVVLIIVILIVLKFWFKVDIIDFLNSGKIQEWLGYVKMVVVAIWERVIQPIINFSK